MSHWGPPSPQGQQQYGSPSPPADEKTKSADVVETAVHTPPPAQFSAHAQAQDYSPTPGSPVGGHYRSASQHSSRPQSMVQTMSPPLMEVSQDTLPELQRIFSFLNAHSTKLYQEGYFLKLHDLDTRTRLLAWPGSKICADCDDRGETEHRQSVDGMLCTTGGDAALLVGCPVA